MRSPPTLALLRAEFPPYGFIPPHIFQVEPLPPALDTVGRLLRAVRAGAHIVEPAHPLGRWPFRALEPLAGDPTDAGLSEWLAAHTVASVSCAFDAGLAQRAHTLDDGTLCADYLFDAHYLAAHPAWSDPDHVALWHGTVAAKLFDDGVSLHTPAQLRAVVRWVSVRAKGTTLGRRGGRSREESAPR